MTVDVNVTLEDKFTLSSGRIYLSGIQALARLPLMQRDHDLANGLNTAGFVSGYRGSPIGGLDQTLWKAKKHLKSHHIEFQPGINEDLAATAVWGTQQVNLFKGAKYDGVFAYWYGKGPGVDRSCDVLRHGNMAGTSKHGGVVLFSGDDHAAKSSTVAYQTDYAYMDLQIPVLHPANVQEVLDYGMLATAMSRYSGCWVALKCLAEVMDSSANVDVDPARHQFVIPTDFEMPADGLHIRWPDTPLDQELRLMRHKLYAALAFARANKLNKVVIDTPNPRLGIVTTGKSYLDVRQALDDLGIDDEMAARIGIRLYKIGMPWPLERQGVRDFAEGLEEIVVIEEKRAIIENQLKEQLYNWREDVRPRVVGKFDEQGTWTLPSAGELTPARIARVLAERMSRFVTAPSIQQRLDFLEAKERSLEAPKVAAKRIPHFCAGCPHNTSTNVPEGSRAVGGIGCHYMVTWMDRSTATFTQMGGEGVPWVGQAPFTDETHIFANLGDGTYYHSGLLAIRQSVAAKVNITYKILFNDAVAMTGGQPHDGPLTVPQIAQQVLGEGVVKVVVVSDEPNKYPINYGFPAGIKFYHRDELDAVQKELRDIPGVTVMIYDQTCAAEKRRRRKRGKMVDPDKRVFVNDLVCEGCGDCGVKSNCVAVEPVETEFGRKRAIDQSSCNKDLSCVNGFCPSFVTVEGGKVRKQGGNAGNGADFGALPAPAVPMIGKDPYDIVITGIGGTGVVTISALIGMAAHLEGKGVSALDQAGLAQKNGAVVSHLRIGRTPDDIHAVRVAAGNARLVLGCDSLTAGGYDTLGKMQQGKTHAVINSHRTMTADFTRKPDVKFPAREIEDVIVDAVGRDAAHFIDATRLATGLLGDSLAANLFLVGYAWQKGLLPLSEEALMRAVELNGTAVDFNRQAFLWGRRAAVDVARVDALLKPVSGAVAAHHRLSETVDEMIARRTEFLTAYQDSAYAARYTALISAVRSAEQAAMPGKTTLTEAVAKAWFKLLAYKDEYEVARLYTDGTFETALKKQFEGTLKLTFHLAPPLLGNRDPQTGRLKKSTFGPWVMTAFKVLAKMKGLRGTAFDIFGYTGERKMQRRLIAEYEAMISGLLPSLSAANHAIAVDLAALPMTMRGYGHVLDKNVEEAKHKEAQLLAAFRSPPTLKAAAE
ncbi:indolepyruvate ferredoxin oxidoreductase family protein [Novispirillum itersonii]|uniref:indolepyruvate ferredoxin oxidoreductase family protein n=1 Tax=Novispirillum itersonii TaxID=189 RepID=UPI000370039E|nr:indolepyruvate ferredoxin oxidoreductase family protein [Novispirillum itersonii]